MKETFSQHITIVISVLKTAFALTNTGNYTESVSIVESVGNNGQYVDDDESEQPH